MKFVSLAVAAFSAVAVNAGTLQERATRSCADPTLAVPFYRLYNGAKSAHIMTAKESERNSLLSSGQWSDDGIAGYIWPSKEPSTEPIYRLRKNDNTDYLYTTSNTEQKQFVKSRGYTLEGISGYVYPSNLCGGKAFYRTFSSQYSDHYYTTSLATRNSITPNGYADEGIAAWLAPPLSC